MKKNVFIVDDSAVVRQVLTEIVNDANDLQVAGVASDPIFAKRHFDSEWPDVVVLDIEMPRMDGITFLKQIMSERPTPVVICSSLAEKGTDLAVTALEFGAVEIITKPQLGIKKFLTETKAKIRNIIRAASEAQVRKIDSKTHRQQLKKASENVLETKVIQPLAHIAQTTDQITAIGCSTGGTLALEQILANLPRTSPGIVVVQHMPEKFTKSFAERLNTISELEVKEAESGDRIIPGRVLIAPGGQHLEVTVSGAQYITRVFSGPVVNRHCPSVDVLFRSVAKNVGRNAKGIIMTGMGNDGAKGLLQMKESGALTVAQDENSCIVFGMPKEAIKLGAADKIVDLEQITRIISA